MVQRILNGAAMNTMQIKVNGDFQEFVFAGPSQDLLDTTSFTSGQGGLTSFPAEPTDTGFDYTIVPGHLGQVWMGAIPTQFLTLTQAELQLDNGIDLRVKEFGSDFARCIAGGLRNVTLNFEIFEQDDDQTSAHLYQAACHEIADQCDVATWRAIRAALRGVYAGHGASRCLNSTTERQDFNGSFISSRAQGSVNDELHIAFG